MFAPALSERARVHCIEADLVDERRDGLLGVLIVARDRNPDALRIVGRLPVVSEVLPLDRV